MSKKSKKKPQAIIAVAAAVNAVAVEPDAPPEPQFRLADMQASARAHIDNKAWAEILALGRVPLTAIHKDDRKSAEVWLLRAKILGLYPSGIRSPYELAREVREEYEGALKELAGRVEALHTLQLEFDLYLDTLGWSIDDCAQAFRRLSRACMELTNVDWLRKLRGRALMLLRAQEGRRGEEMSAADQETLAALPDLTLALSEAYAAAEQGEALDEEGRALVTVLRLDLDLMMADPWDYGRVGDALLRLPCPSEGTFIALPKDESSGRAQLHLTPRAWAFMWTLGHTPGEGFADLLQRFSEPFACDACEGLRRVLCALSAVPADVDEHLSLAVRALMRFADADAHWFGEQLTMTLSDGVREIYVGMSGLHMTSVGDLLLRLYEHSSEDFTRRAELESSRASIGFSPPAPSTHRWRTKTTATRTCRALPGYASRACPSSSRRPTSSKVWPVGCACCSTPCIERQVLACQCRRTTTQATSAARTLMSPRPGRYSMHSSSCRRCVSRWPRRPGACGSRS